MVPIQIHIQDSRDIELLYSATYMLLRKLQDQALYEGFEYILKEDTRRVNQLCDQFHRMMTGQ